MLRRTALTLGLSLAIACGGATTGEVVSEVGLQVKRAVPFTQSSATVETVAERAGYLESWVVSSEPGRLRYLFPPTDACRRLLRPEAQLTFADEGTFGEFFDAQGEHCDPIGTLTLVEWRRHKRNPNSPAYVPVTYRVIYSDEEFVFLRGRFPLVSWVGVGAGYDIVSVVTNAPECEKVFQETTASMEFLGHEPWLVLISEGQCPIRGLAIPLPAPAAGEAPRELP